MLLDNKIDYSAVGDLPGTGVKTVLDFIRKYTSLDSGRKGDLDIVTGFFTIAGLDLLYKELAPDNKYRLVLSELAGKSFRPSHAPRAGRGRVQNQERIHGLHQLHDPRAPRDFDEGRLPHKMV